MSKIFDGDSDSDVDFRSKNQYAKNYDNWRKKEELNKLQTKYGENINLGNDESSSSSDDDEDGIELTEKIEKDFYKTLAALKNKDPRIYDENVKFFDERQEDDIAKKKKNTAKTQPMYLKDYERNLILEKGGKLSDSEEEEDNRPRSPTYVEEQLKIKENIKKALNNVNEDEEDNWGGLFKAREKSEVEKTKEESDYKDWLAGQKSKLEDQTEEKELKPLREYWNNPNLDSDEKFLRDYILKKKFLDNDDPNYIPTYEEVVHDSDESLSGDEENIEKQEEFEHKYNFRFEEPDQEFIKRYPRTMENSLRRKDDKRKVKRAEVKERKQKEKDEKMQEIKKLKELKKKEIEEKIEKLKQITGNTDVGFQDQDLDEDFDPDEHDKRMQSLFNDDFYKGPENDQKPEFPDLDQELEIENWESYNSQNGSEDYIDNGNCEDEDFNMDCDYDPKSSSQAELMENSKGKKKRRRKSKFLDALKKPKPKFDPSDKTYDKYLDEYYQLDCEDIIGDIPCRFKYRQVAPNSFGLSTEEILLANDRELNKWCSIKKAIQIRPDHVEKYDQIAFEKKGQNINLKKKLLPSLFEEEKSEKTKPAEREVETHEKSKTVKNEVVKSEKNKLEKRDVIENKTVSPDQTKVKKRKNKKGKMNENQNEKPSTSESKQENGSMENEVEENCIQTNEINTSTSLDKSTTENVKKNETAKKKKKKKKNKNNNEKIKSNNQDNEKTQKTTDNLNENSKKPKNIENRKRKASENSEKRSKKFKKNSKSEDIGISDARLQAFGIKPKKFKNKLKYGNKNIC